MMMIMIMIVEMGCVESTRAAGGCSESCKGAALQIHVGDGSCSCSAQLDPTAGAAATAAPVDNGDSRDELLTSEERAVLNADWQHLAHVNHQHMGMRIFLRIFELEPSAKRSFAELQGLEGEELMSNTMFRCHGGRFMRAVAAAVDGLDTLDLVVIPNLIHLGRLHKSVYGLSWRHLQAFEQAMNEVWVAELNDCSARSPSESTRSALVWAKVFRLITSKVFEGFQLSSEASSVTAVKLDEQNTNGLSLESDTGRLAAEQGETET